MDALVEDIKRDRLKQYGDVLGWVAVYEPADEPRYPSRASWGVLADEFDRLAGGQVEAVRLPITLRDKAGKPRSRLTAKQAKADKAERDDLSFQLGLVLNRLSDAIACMIATDHIPSGFETPIEPASIIELKAAGTLPKDFDTSIRAYRDRARREVLDNRFYARWERDWRECVRHDAVSPRPPDMIARDPKRGPTHAESGSSQSLRFYTDLVLQHAKTAFSSDFRQATDGAWRATTVHELPSPGLLPRIAIVHLRQRAQTCADLCRVIAERMPEQAVLAGGVAKPKTPHGVSAKLPKTRRGFQRLAETTTQDQPIIAAIKEGKSYRQVASECKVGKTTVERVAKAYGLTGHAPQSVPLEGTLQENLSVRGNPGKRRSK
jgi:hypothetical protein